MHYVITRNAPAILSFNLKPQTSGFFLLSVRSEGELLSIVVDGDRIAFADDAADDIAAEGRFYGVDDEAAQRTGTELRVIAPVGQCLQRFVCPGEVDFDLFFQTFAQTFEQDGCDVADLIFAQCLEDDDVIDTVEEFRTEILLEQFPYGFFCLGKIFRFQDFMGTEVTGHDDDRILEVDDPAFAIGQAAIIENLQQDVENIGMSLFDFIEEDDAVGVTAYGFGELTAFIIADISRRRTDQTGYGVLFHVFRHIDTDDIAFVVKEGFCQCLCQFGLADTGRSEEDERADRTIGVLDTGTGTDDGIADDADGFILADDTLMEGIVEVKQFFPFAGHHLGNGDACSG